MATFLANQINATEKDITGLTAMMFLSKDKKLQDI